MPHDYPVVAKFHHTDPTGPGQTKSADFVGDPGLVRSGPCSGIELITRPFVVRAASADDVTSSWN